MLEPRVRRRTRLSAALVALTLSVGLTACGGGGASTPDVSGAPPFTVPTPSADTAVAAVNVGSSTSSSSSTATTSSSGTSTTGGATTSSAGSATTPAAPTTTAAAPTTTPSGGTGTPTTGGGTGTNGGAGLGSAFCQQNPGAC